MEQKLLTRDQFRNAVFQRDNHKCVYCGNDGQDAHHIMERRLFKDGGYYIENGATLCGDCHIKAEQTLISTEELREAIGITKVVLPPHAYADQRYDKWLNPILANETRIHGELFDDPSVQKVLAPVLHLYTNLVKYPRTWHCPWSLGATSDDRIISQEVIDKWNWEVVITEKMDGESTTIYNDYLHARSLDYESHPSRDKIKALHSQIAYNIPKNWRVCGENLTAVHSIKYANLKSIFEVFSIWDGPTCLSWDDTITYTQLLGLETVPVIYRGVFDEQVAKDLVKGLDLTKQEGYVIRPSGSFHMKEFKTVVGKYVRAKHVQTRGGHGHWMRQKLEFNEVL